MLEIIACVDSKAAVTIEIPLTDRILLESSVFLSAQTNKQSKLEIACTDNLTLRSLLKIGEYCSFFASMANEEKNEKLVPPTFTTFFIYDLGIFGTPFLRECLIAATVLDFKVFKQMLKQALEDKLFPD
jgi:hypothetical protein